MNYEITYTKREDYYIPNLTLTKSKYSDYKLAKYGRIRARYLKEHKKAEYTILLIDGKLDDIVNALLQDEQKEILLSDK